MNLFSLLIKALRSDPWRAFPCTAIAGATLLALALPPAVHGKLALYLMQGAALFMLFLSSSASTRLAHTAQILVQRRVPQAVWMDSVTLRLASVWANGGALLAALSLQSAFIADTRWLAGAATLSLAACAGTLFSTLRSGLLARLRNRTVYAVALAALLAFCTYGQAALAAFVRLPSAPLLLLAASWPALAFALQRYWRVMPRLQPPAQTVEIPAWTGKIVSYTILQPRFLQDNNLQASLLSGLRMGTATLCWVTMEPLALGGVVTAGHLLALIPWIPAAMGLVAMRNLHWRTLLTPAGSGAQTLAMRIYRASITLALFLLLVVMLGQAALDASMGRGVAYVAANLEKWAVFCMQAPLLVAVAVLLSALPNPRRTMWGAFIAAYLVLSVIHVAKLYSVPVTGLHAGVGYLAGMLALSGLVLLAASRMWTQNRLLPYLPARQPSLAAFSAAR